MSRYVLLASFAATIASGCRVSLENQATADAPVTVSDGGVARSCTVSTTQQDCLDAVSHSDLAWIQTNIFTKSCIFSGCHNGAQGGPSTVDLRSGMSATHMVDFTSHIDPSRKIVVPNDVNASYMMLLVGDFPPAMASPPAAGLPSVGLMPQNMPPLCCQKLDALERWISSGSPTQ
jgi:hypothetical protein